jgi:hypothetical protein
VIAGLDIETDLAYALRIIARRQNRPASGNHADWAEWVLAYAGVVDVYVYPLLQPGTVTVPVPGCVTVLALSAAPGDTTGNRIFGGVSGGNLTNTIGQYIEGTGGDGSVGAQPTGIQLRPVTMAPENYRVQAALASTLDIEIQCVMSTAYRFPWAYNASYTVLASPAPTATTFSVNTDITSVVKPGGSIQPILVNVDTSNYRGGYYFVTPTSVLFNGGTGHTDFIVPTLPAAPTATTIVLPGPSNFSSIRTQIFGLFDVLGPGDTTPPSRWPSEETKGRSTLYLPAITSRIVQELDAFGNLLSGVRGILSATMVNPSATVVSAPKTLLQLGVLTIRTA